MNWEKLSSSEMKFDFFKGESDFIQQILSLYGSCELKIDRLLEFKVSLPFQVPIPNNSMFSFRMEKCVLHYRYEADESKSDSAETGYFPIAAYSTSVIIGVGFNSVLYENDELHEDIMSYLFDSSLRELNKQIIAYMTCVKDDGCFRVTKEMLSPAIVMNLVDLEECSSSKTIFLTHLNMPHKKEELDSKTVANFLRIYSIYDKNLNPFILAELYFLTATRKLREGFYDEAIVSVQTNIEMIIRIIFREFLLASGESENSVEKTLECASFMSIVKREMSKIIGGVWDVNRTNSPLRDWYYSTYKVRNRIVHAGYCPTLQDARMAVESAGKFREYIFDLLRKSPQNSKLKMYIL